MARLGGILQIDPRGIILGFVPVPNGDLLTTNFAFGGPDNQYIYLEGATSGTFWRLQAPSPGLVGPGGVRLPVQPGADGQGGAFPHTQKGQRDAR